MNAQKQNEQEVNTNPMIITPSNGVGSNVLSFHFKKNLTNEEACCLESEINNQKSSNTS